MQPPNRNKPGQGFVEYFLIVVIVILFVMIVARLLGPAINNFIQDSLQNV
ncbi:MAG: hypothetical protein PWQ55_1368 [Chloroflexota bacterium]|nr:hypothetical protein [Chloroflexota bacterium]